jgi:DNA-binding FadR family transcriptional regulator
MRDTIPPALETADTEPPPALPQDPHALGLLLERILDEASAARIAATRAADAALEALAELRALPCRREPDPPPCLRVVDLAEGAS